MSKSEVRRGPLHKIRAVESATEFLRRRAGDARAEDLKAILAGIPDAPPAPGDEMPERVRPKVVRIRSEG